MTVPRSSACGLSIAITFVLCAVAMPASGQTRQTPRSPSTPLIDSTHPVMQAEEVALKGDTNVFGDPSKPGTYVLRRSLTASQTARPHYDDQDRWVTVLKGTLWIGKGDVFSPEKLLPVREGGIAYLPANTHYFEIAGDAEVILQITGNGPVKSVHTEVDAKGQSVPEKGPYPVLASARGRRKMPVDPDLIDPDQLDQMEREAAARKAAASAKAAATPGTVAPAAPAAPTRGQAPTGGQAEPKK
jgi:hypothetical protein